MTKVEPNRNVYIGHRYVPKIFGEWDKQNEYEGLSIVTYQGASYTSKKRVPVGIDILNEEFWIVTGNYNAQVEYYRQDVRKVQSDLSDLDTKLTSDLSDLDTKLTDNVNNLDIKLSDEIDKVNERVSDNVNALEKKSGILKESITLNIPSDFNSFMEAINYINESHITVNTPIIINIERGHKPILRSRLEMGSTKNIILTSDNDTVFLGDVLEDSNTLFDLYKHEGFTLDCLIDMEGKGNHGLYLDHGSSVKVNAGKGIINAGNCGLYARGGSTAYAENTLFTGASKIDGNSGAGITAWSSTVNASGADVSGSNYYGARAAHGGVLNFDNGKADNCGRHAIRASQSGLVTCRESSAKNSGSHGIYALDTSNINARESDVSGSKGTGFFAQSGSNINAFLGIANNCNIGVSAQQGSTVNFYSGTSNSCKQKNLEAINSGTIEGRNFKSDSKAFTCVHAVESSIINIQACRIENSVGNAIKAELGSKVNASVSNILNNGGSNASAHGVISDKGSEVVVFNANVVTSGGLDLYINNGSRIIANECNTTLSEGSNEPNIEDCSPSEFNQMWSRGTIYA